MNNKPEKPDISRNNESIDAATAVLEDLESLRKRSEERDQFLVLLQRTQADFENYQKRNQREREQERRYMHQGLASGLLPIFDNLERAMDAAQKAGESGPLVQGVQMVHSQILTLLQKHGITRIEAEGKPFDPNEHEAVMQQPTKDVAPNTVVKALEQGFKIHDRVLRPARVIVSTPTE
jgi:molecular chaperone GrpE